MPVHDDLGKRMKEFYEQVPKSRLVRRMPVAIRIDGKAFHTFTRGFQKPLDPVLVKTMQETMKYLCENIQGCVVGYTQSDEITLILVDYKKLNSSAWFDYEVQKMCSIAASMATMAFNKFFVQNYLDYVANKKWDLSTEEGKSHYKNIVTAYEKASNKGAMFDARVFNIPKEEVTNLIYWRQLDAMRNSVQMVGQALYSHKELQNKTCNDIKKMLLEEMAIDWERMDNSEKWGSFCIKMYQITEDHGVYESHAENKMIPGGRSYWSVSTQAPLLKGDMRSYVDDLINVGE